MNLQFKVETIKFYFLLIHSISWKIINNIIVSENYYSSKFSMKLTKEQSKEIKDQ